MNKMRVYVGAFLLLAGCLPVLPAMGKKPPAPSPSSPPTAADQKKPEAKAAAVTPPEQKKLDAAGFPRDAKAGPAEPAPEYNDLEPLKKPEPVAAPAVDKKQKEKQAVPKQKPEKKKKETARKPAGEEAPGKVSERQAEGFLKQARTFYNAGELDDAEEILDSCLKYDPGNRAALDFRDKIVRLRGRILQVQRSTADEFMLNADYFYMKENLPEALLWAERAVRLNPKSEGARNLARLIQQEKERSLGNVNRNDKKEFDKALEYFLKEDFENAARLFRKLQRYYPEFGDYLSSTIIHSADEKNSKRSREYIFDALDSMRKGRYRSAQESLYLALEMDKNSLYARFMLEQVNLELESSGDGIPAL